MNDTGTEIEGDTGAAQNTENEPISSADAAGTWDYTITRTEESTTYSFERGPQIVMPASWGSQVTEDEEGQKGAKGQKDPEEYELMGDVVYVEEGSTQ